MSIGSIRCRPPYCGKSLQEQTKGSCILRVTALFIGTIALLEGLLTLLKVPVFHSLGTIGGGVFMGMGGGILLAALCIYPIKLKIWPKRSQQHENYL